MIRKNILAGQVLEYQTKAEYYERCLKELRALMKSLRREDVEAKYNCATLETFLNDMLEQEYELKDN